MALTPAQQNTAQLMRALGFSADELLMNRAGQLSPAQAQRVAAQMKASTQAGWRIAAFVLLATIGGFVYIVLRSDLAETIGDNPVILIVLGGILLLWGLMVVFALTRGKTQANKGAWPVHQVTGRVKVNVARESFMDPTARAAMAAGGPGVADGTIQIGRTYLAIWEPAARAFIPDRPYTVYYVGSEQGGLPISAEALEEAPGRR